MKNRYSKEWNISYAIHDGYGGLDEYFVVLPSLWKLLLWFVRRGRKACEIYIWVGEHKEGAG